MKERLIRRFRRPRPPAYVSVVHGTPAACDLGFLKQPCPACHAYLRDAHEATIALSDATDTDKNEALHWLADERPDVVLQALRAVRVVR